VPDLYGVREVQKKNRFNVGSYPFVFCRRCVLSNKEVDFVKTRSVAVG
jgi:hypothetical protein